MKVLKENWKIIGVLGVSFTMLVLTKSMLHNINVNYMWFVMLSMLFLLTCSLLFLKEIEIIPVEKIIFIQMLLSGLLLAFINPFGQEPDGWVHFLRSVDVSYGNLLAPFWDNNGSGELMNVPANIDKIGFKKIEINQSEAVQYMKNIKELYFTSKKVQMKGLGGFASIFYLPQSMGLFVARILKLNVYSAMILGRTFNLLTYVSLAYTGLKKIPICKNIYIIVAFLPMTIYQAASFSYDAMLMGLCFLFIALCLNYAYSKEKLTWKDVLILGIILALLLLCKYVYVCIGLLVCIIPMKKFGEKKSYWKAFLIALMPIIIMSLLMVVSSSVTISTNSVVSGMEIKETTQLEHVISNPIYTLKVILRTFETYFSYHTEQLNTLGWLNYKLGPLVVLVPVFMGMVSVLDTNNISGKVSKKDKLIYVLTFGITVLASMMGLYLMDGIANPVGASVILGYQGRYTIPVLMLLLMTVPNTCVKNKIDNFSHKVLGVMSVFMCITIVMLVRYCY